jgi:FlaA1/EpsC-like NDP-sugar epimerase
MKGLCKHNCRLDYKYEVSHCNLVSFSFLEYPNIESNHHWRARIRRISCQHPTTMSIVGVLTEIRKTNVTNTIHRVTYDAISPTRTELSQAGRSVLITGGGTGVGFSMAQAFVRASASTIIIVGRRTKMLNSARLKLEDEVKTLGTSTRIVTRPCDDTKASDIDAVWQYLSDENIFVDGYIANAAKFTEPAPMMELGTEEVWSQIETNVWSPLYFTEKFCKQPGDKQKVSPSPLPPEGF